MKEIKIGCDIDNVALNYLDRFEKVFKLFGGKSDLSLSTEFNLFKFVLNSEKRALLLSFGYMMNEVLPIYDGFEKMIKFILSERDQRLQFITARNSELSYDSAYKSLSKAICESFGFSFNTDNLFSIDCVGCDEVNCGHVSKMDKIKQYGFEYFIDDRRKNVLEISKEGVIVFMPRRHYNYLPEDTKNVIQYNDVSQVISYLRLMH